MKSLNRRKFLSLIPGSLAAAALPLIPIRTCAQPAVNQSPTKSNSSCWLDLAAPFIVEDESRSVRTEIILTSDTFVGTRGYRDGIDATDYEIYLYEPDGKPIGDNGIARKLTVPAMNVTVLNARDLIGARKAFWGSMKIRVRPNAREPMPASDLFSSAFVRWQTGDSFDNVHANPDPLQWQHAESFYYSMPFPRLDEYLCTLAVFNPNDTHSTGEITISNYLGKRLGTYRYALNPHASLLLSLNTREYVTNAAEAFVDTSSKNSPATENDTHGLVAIRNDSKAVKSFAYLLIKDRARSRFTIDHPIHQGIVATGPETPSFDTTGNFKARNVLYSPLLFRGKKFAGLTLETRCYFGSGFCPEPTMWLAPFATDGEGAVKWDGRTDPKLSSHLPASQIRDGVIRLAAEQSCMLDFRQLTMAESFSGGLSLAVSPDTTHSLMKVEVRVPEWQAHAFTHFRPGFRAAHSYQRPSQRGGIATDYVSSGARLQRQNKSLLFDELIAVINIDPQEIAGQPMLEIFSSAGLVTRISLGPVPAFACRHYLLSELLAGFTQAQPLTLRLVDERATLLMSTVHFDYTRRDIALDHGSDRFSTLLDYPCTSKT